jgi:transposase InsO family protein
MRCLLRDRESVTAKFELIDAEKANYAIVDMCAWIEVSRSGYYDWRSRPTSATVERRGRLKAMIATIFHANHETYGYRRIHAVLQRSGELVSPELVRRLMRGLGLRACQPAPWRPVTTTSAEDALRPASIIGAPGAVPAGSARPGRRRRLRMVRSTDA